MAHGVTYFCITPHTEFNDRLGFCSFSQKFLSLLWDLKVHYCVHKSPHFIRHKLFFRLLDMPFMNYIPWVQNVKFVPTRVYPSPFTSVQFWLLTSLQKNETGKMNFNGAHISFFYKSAFLCGLHISFITHIHLLLSFFNLIMCCTLMAEICNVTGLLYILTSSVFWVVYLFYIMVLMRSYCHPCVCPVTFESVGRFLWNSVGRSCHWRWTQYHTLRCTQNLH
jgi:hypothetical protein